MTPTFSLGRIAGIRVGAHWSVLAIWWLLTWSLATGVLPDAAAGHATGLYWAAAAVTATVFFGCLLAHELSHAVVARRHGLHTDGITLWMLGGVARLRDESPTPGVELRVAGAGPAMSVAVAAAAGVVALVVDALGGPGLVVAAAGWLALINLVLAVFNLLPGFPLDGGRLLHALLWRRSGDRPGATRQAAGVGRVFAYLLIAMGVLEFTSGYWSGLWLAFIGMFLLSASTAETEMSGLKEVLGDLRVADVMTAEPDVVGDWVSVEELLAGHMMRRHHTSFPVQDRFGTTVGLVTLAQVRALPPDRRTDTAVGAITVPLTDLPTTQADELFVDVLPQLSGRGTRALVFDGPRLAGIVTPTDVARTFAIAGLSVR